MLRSSIVAFSLVFAAVGCGRNTEEFRASEVLKEPKVIVTPEGHSVTLNTDLAQQAERRGVKFVTEKELKENLKELFKKQKKAMQILTMNDAHSYDFMLHGDYAEKLRKKIGEKLEQGPTLLITENAFQQSHNVGLVHELKSGKYDVMKTISVISKSDLEEANARYKELGLRWGTNQWVLVVDDGDVKREHPREIINRVLGLNFLRHVFWAYSAMNTEVPESLLNQVKTLEQKYKFVNVKLDKDQAVVYTLGNERVTANLSVKQWEKISASLDADDIQISILNKKIGDSIKSVVVLGEKPRKTKESLKKATEVIDEFEFIGTQKSKFELYKEGGILALMVKNYGDAFNDMNPLAKRSMESVGEWRKHRDLQEGQKEDLTSKVYPPVKLIRSLAGTVCFWGTCATAYSFMMQDPALASTVKATMSSAATLLGFKGLEMGRAFRQSLNLPIWMHKVLDGFSDDVQLQQNSTVMTNSLLELLNKDENPQILTVLELGHAEQVIKNLTEMHGFEAVLRPRAQVKALP